MDTALTLTTDMELVLALVVFTMVMFLFERVRADVVALVVLVVLGLTGLVPREDLFGGFSGSAVMSIIATMILGAGLDRTGALNRLAGWLLRRAISSPGTALPTSSSPTPVLAWARSLISPRTRAYSRTSSTST